ncbi:MAG: NAD-dependent epimerase/dehydratase family protein [Bacteroidota bacterium]
MTESYKLLITGGAGFIGSNLVERYIDDPKISLIRVVDDLSNGSLSNIQPFLSNPKFEFIEADICNYDVCLNVTKGIDKISHQAGLGSVPRSIENPVRSAEVNIMGTINMMKASCDNKVDRIVLACSSSTYGSNIELPKREDKIGNPVSPYAATKLVVEIFADVFAATYGLDYIGLRYFNIFGPKQSLDNPYAAVIPVFCNAFIKDTFPVINGDGETSRDFTYVDNAVLANDLALFTENREAINKIYNVACGDQVSLNEIVGMLTKITGKKIFPEYRPERKGDIKHSRASIERIEKYLGYKVSVRFFEGLEKTYQSYLKK